MKITKETLIQLIKEELAELQEQRIDREAEADADVRQSIARGLSRAGKTVAAKVRGLDPRTAQKKRAAGYKSMADKEFDDPRVGRARAEEDSLKMGISATLANMPAADQKKWLADYGDLPIRQQAYKLGLLENRVPNADMLEEIILEEFEAVLSEASAGLDKLKEEIAKVHRKMTDDGQTPKFLVARSGISDGEIQGFKDRDRAGVSDNWKWTVYLYDQDAIQRGQKEGVEAEDVLTEDEVLEDLKRDLKKYQDRLEKEDDAHRKARLQKTINNLKQRIRTRMKGN